MDVSQNIVSFHSLLCILLICPLEFFSSWITL